MYITISTEIRTGHSETSTKTAISPPFLNIGINMRACLLVYFINSDIFEGNVWSISDLTSLWFCSMWMMQSHLQICHVIAGTKKTITYATYNPVLFYKHENPYTTFNEFYLQYLILFERNIQNK